MPRVKEVPLESQNELPTETVEEAPEEELAEDVQEEAKDEEVAQGRSGSFSGIPMMHSFGDRFRCSNDG